MDDFEAHRDHLRAVAHRILGSANEADDAVQETWIRLARTGLDGVDNPRAWLTTVVARVCLDMLRSRKARREIPVDQPPPQPADTGDPEREAVQADTVGAALLMVLDTLTPAERLAFVLHDIFAVPFAEIAPIVSRTPDAAKMLASRARTRVRAARPPGTDTSRHKAVVEAFLAASRNGDFAALLDLLDPDVTARADTFAAPPGTPTHLRGAHAVARQALAFSHRAVHAHVGIVNGAAAIIVTPHGRLATVMMFAVSNGKVVALDIIANPQTLEQLALSENR